MCLKLGVLLFPVLFYISGHQTTARRVILFGHCMLSNTLKEIQKKQ